MKLSNEQLKSIYFGALFFEETEDGYLQAFQYTKSQMEYFKRASAFWYDRCFATTAKTLEFFTDAAKLSFSYRFLWRGSEDSVELWVSGAPTQIYYVKDMGEDGSLSFGRKPWRRWKCTTKV